MRVLWLNPAWRVALLYAMFGGLWILVSDWLLSTLAADWQQLVAIQLIKGWCFVAASAALIYLLLRYEKKKHRRAEQVLRENEERYRLLFDHSADGIALFSPDGAFINVTTAMRGILGFEPEAVIGQNWTTQAYPDDLAAALEKWSRLIEHDGHIEFIEFRLRHADGSWRWIEATGHNLLAEPNIGAIVANFRDITARKQAEEKMRLYMAMFEYSKEAIAISDSAGRLVYINSAHKKLFGRSLAEAQQMNYRDFYPPESIEVLDCQTAPALARGEGWEGDLMARDATGRLFPLWERADSILDNHGRMLYAFGFMHDITERKQMENALRESEARFRETIENAQIGYFFVDTEGGYRYVNKTWLAMHGYDAAEEVIGQSFSITQVETDLEQARQLGEQVLAREPISSGEFARRCKDGSIKFHTFSSRPVTKGGQVIGLEGFMTDITERKRAKQKLAEYTAQLRALSQRLVKTQEMERRSIARELHDEVGQIMLAVKTNLETMQLVSKSAALKARLADSVAIVSRALEQIRELALDLRPSLLDDFGLMPTLEWYLERQAKDAPFKINFQADLPDMRFSPDIEASCFRVTQAALTNITRHARATQMDVTLRWLPATQILELSVRDNGVGFDVPTALDHARHGQSLGLLGMQERAQLIGGQFALQSTPGGGTEICVRVPIKAEG